MKKLFLFAILVLFASCTAEQIEEKKTKPQVQAIHCGNVFTISTIYTPTNVFIGVRYEVVLDVPYFDGTSTWTKASIILNNAQNTPSLNQYSIGQNMCGNVSAGYFYN